METIHKVCKGYKNTPPQSRKHWNSNLCVIENTHTYVPPPARSVCSWQTRVLFDLAHIISSGEFMEYYYYRSSCFGSSKLKGCLKSTMAILMMVLDWLCILLVRQPAYTKEGTFKAQPRIKLINFYLLEKQVKDRSLPLALLPCRILSIRVGVQPKGP